MAPGSPDTRVSDPVSRAVEHSHLDGLNLSRAWCWVRVGAALDPSDVRRHDANEAAARHREAGYPSVSRTGYMGAHWLATFAELARGGDGP